MLLKQPILDLHTPTKKKVTGAGSFNFHAGSSGWSGTHK